MHSRIPAEWEPQAVVILCWPHKNTDWVTLLSAAEVAFAKLASTISHYQKLILLIPPKQQQANIANHLEQYHAQLDNIDFCYCDTNDTWCRDYGPISIIHEQQTQLYDFTFDGWNQRHEWQLDDSVTQCLAKTLLRNYTTKKLDFILEGGSIDSNGAGTILTTSQCLLNRDNGLNSKEQTSTKLQSLLPVEKILWLDHGYLSGDDTDSHIDNLARFVNAETIVYLKCDNSNDEHYVELEKMHNQLKTFQHNNTPYKLIPITMPRPIYSQQDKRRLPASYINFLILNKIVLVPQFNDPADEAAIKILQDCFPNRKAIGIDSTIFIEQNGGVHCLTMQIMSNNF